MNRRSLTIAISITASCIVASVLLLVIDGYISINGVSPVPSNEAAAAAQGAGWNADLIHLRSINAVGGPFGSSAVVKYDVDDAKEPGVVEVRLRRRFLSSSWEVEAIETL